MLSKYFPPAVEMPQTDQDSTGEPRRVIPPSIPPSPNLPPAVLPGTPQSAVQAPQIDNVFFTSTPFDITLAQEFLQVLHYNPRRKYLLVQNTTIADIDNDGSIQIIFDDAPAIGSASIKRSVTLNAGGAYEPIKCPTNPITIRATSPLAEGVVIEGQ